MYSESGATGSTEKHSTSQRSAARPATKETFCVLA
jgi:hypothetical protein